MGQFAGTQTDKYPPTATPTPGYPYNQEPARRPAQIPSVFATLQTALHKSICTTKSAPAGGWWTMDQPGPTCFENSQRVAAAAASITYCSGNVEHNVEERFTPTI